MAEIIPMPKLGFDMQEGTLVRWVRVEGEAVEKGQVLAEIETDKATVEVESNASGIVYKHLVEQGSIVPVGSPIAVIAAPGEEVSDFARSEAAPAKARPAQGDESETAATKVEAKAPAEAGESDGRIKASPLARKMAEEEGVDLAEIKGSGPGGRIVRADIEAAMRAPKAAPVAAPAVHPAAAPAPAKTISAPAPAWSGTVIAPEDQRVEMGKLRAAIGRRMVESKQNFPHFYVTGNYNMAPVMNLRSQMNDLLPDDQKLTVNDYVLKAAALTLREFPNLNASIRDKAIVRHGHIHIGVAVAVEGGLLTIVCRDADQKPLRLISMEVREMAARARTGKVRPDDIEGSTFSISNLGMYGVEEFGAIINPPEAAILAVGAAQKVPVVVNDEIKVGVRMKATLSADHRVTDGAEAAQFMQALTKYLEQPLRLVM